MQIDGKWYHIDATWMDYGGKVNEKYFMVNDAQISKTHEIGSYAERQRAGRIRVSDPGGSAA